tara:strand:- start:253 stop:699 length:447 start_codon:yes stop_codon:yes gene_type:complete
LTISEDFWIRIKTSGLLILAALVVGCAGSPGPGDSGYPYNVAGDYSGSLTVAGVTMTGTIQVSTQPGGAVTGTVSVNRPIQINGTLNGALAGDQLTVGIAYGNNPATGCSGGTMDGALTIAEHGANISGAVKITDCGEILDATIDFSR